MMDGTSKDGGQALANGRHRSRTHRRYTSAERGDRHLAYIVQLSATSHFTNDLGLDSLDTVEVVMAIEEVGGGRCTH